MEEFGIWVEVIVAMLVAIFILLCCLKNNSIKLARAKIIIAILEMLLLNTSIIIGQGHIEITICGIYFFVCAITIGVCDYKDNKEKEND